LTQELRDPAFGEYYLYFSNALQKSSIERLAECDSHEVVREVQEYFADFVAINPDLFSLNVSSPEYSLFVESAKAWNPATLTRVTEGITGALLALKKKPLIRYEANSALARKLSAEISYSIQNEGPLYDFRRTDTPPILMILDRRNDPVTPLLNQWTYQAMIHELLGITNGRVDLSEVKDVRPENKEIVLSWENDAFFKENMFLNLGDLGSTIKNYVDEFQSKHNSTKKIESIADMKRFVEDYPEFRKLSGNVSKHVTLVGELSRRVAQGKLLEIGELEQSLAVSESHSNDSKMLEQVLNDNTIDNEYKTRLVLLYALRYEKTPNSKVPQYLELLKKSGASESLLSLVSSVITYAGSEVRLEPASPVEDFIGRTKNVFKGLQVQKVDIGCRKCIHTT
jgi:hypothetical protein